MKHLGYARIWECKGAQFMKDLPSTVLLRSQFLKSWRNDDLFFTIFQTLILFTLPLRDVEKNDIIDKKAVHL